MFWLDYAPIGESDMAIYYFHRFLVGTMVVFLAWLTYHFLKMDYFDKEVPSYRRAIGAGSMCLALSGYFIYYLKTLKKHKEFLEKKQ